MSTASINRSTDRFTARETAAGTAAVRATADHVRDLVSAAADSVDAGRHPTTEHLSTLAGLGLLDLGVDTVADPLDATADIRGSAELIALVAEECMSTAFSIWAHRMVLDYFARGARTERNAAAYADLRLGLIAGSTAMASGMKALAGIEPLGVTGRIVDDTLVVDGQVRWASNLVPGAVVVIPVQLDDDQRLIAWFRVGDDGVEVHPVDGLLALNATASASIRLDGVRIPLDAVLSWTFADTARAFRPTFLTLQSSFCIGIARRSVAESGRLIDRPGNDGLHGRFAEVERLLAEQEAAWERLIADVGSAPLVDFVRLRLESSLLAGEATRLEAALAGGRGYLSSSDTARRFREAAFLPVQSPSEGQLRWELTSLS